MTDTNRNELGIFADLVAFHHPVSRHGVIFGEIFLEEKCVFEAVNTMCIR